MGNNKIIAGFVYIGDDELEPEGVPLQLRTSRQHVMVVKGRYTRVHKRPRPDNECEVCREYNQHLNYHHWDDKHPELGLWICQSCHKLVHNKCKYIDLTLLDRYHKLKDNIRISV